MSADNKAHMRRFIEDGWNAKNPAVFDGKIAERFVSRTSSGGFKGPNGYNELRAGVTSAPPGWVSRDTRRSAIGICPSPGTLLALTCATWKSSEEVIGALQAGERVVSIAGAVLALVDLFLTVHMKHDGPIARAITRSVWNGSQALGRRSSRCKY